MKMTSSSLIDPSRSQVLGLLLATIFVLGATAGLASAAATTDLAVSITDNDNTIEPGETTTVQIAVSNADGGVGAASYGIELSDPSVAEITDAEITGSPVEPAIQEDGSSADIRYFQAETDDSGGVVVLTVTLQAIGSGSTSIDIVNNSEFNNLVVFDEEGAGYTFDTVESATLTVNTPPSADAGGDQTVTEGETVTLDASASNDPDGDTLSYSWTVTDDAGTGVSLSDASAAEPTFTAPTISEDTTLDFEVEVSDGTATDTDSVSVTVQPSEPAAADFQVSNLQAPGSATQGDAIDVSADVENTGGQSATKAVEFRVDTDGDGEIADESTVTSQTVQLDASNSTTVTFEDVDTSGLGPGTLTHGVFTVDDSATAQITINAPPEANFQVSNLQAPGSATQGDLIDVSADVENTGGQSATKAVEFRIDVDGDGIGDDDDVVFGQDVELAPGETTTVEFADVNTSALPIDTFTHGVVTPDDSATAQIEITEPPIAGETTVSLQPGDQTSAVGTTTTYDIVVDNAQGGVGAGEIRVAVDDASIAEIIDADVADDNASEEVEVADPGTFVDIEYAFADTADTGPVTIATVTVEGAGEGTAGLSIVPADDNDGVLIFDEDGAGYDVTGTDGATFEVLPIQFLVDTVNASEKVAVGDTVTVAATVSSDGAVESTQSVELLFDVDGDGAAESVETKQVTIGPSGQTQVSFDVQVPADADFGDRSYSVETVADSAGGVVEFTPPDVNGDGNLPSDADGDGLYEDVNGDGDLNTGDAQALFSNRESAVIQSYLDAYDFNGDGVVNVGDAQVLFTEITV